LDLGGFRRSKNLIEPFLSLTRATSNPSSRTLKDVPSNLKVEFESTLRYVDIPVPDLPQKSNVVGTMPIRTEVKDILEWLRGQKGVQGIFELRVRDSPYVSHSEEVVDSCLAGFDVEILDWKRPNMSLEPVILNCPNIQKATLYASSWCTLQYWTSEQVHRDLHGCLRKVSI
jgi:hypothetical protein